MKQLTKWATGGVVLAVVIVLSGCSSAGTGSTFGNETRNSTNNASIQKSNRGFNNNSAMGNATSVVENASASNTPSPTASVPPSVTLENIQYFHDSLLLSLTHGNMQETYSNPHFTSGTTKQFVITLRNTNPGKYPMNQVEPVNSNWAKSVVMTKVGRNLVMTFDLKKSFQSFQAGVAGGFEIQFSFR